MTPNQRWLRIANIVHGRAGALPPARVGLATPEETGGHDRETSPARSEDTSRAEANLLPALQPRRGRQCALPAVDARVLGSAAKAHSALVLTTPAHSSSKILPAARAESTPRGSAPPLGHSLRDSMDDAELKRRLWEGFAGLQTLLGGARQERLRAPSRRTDRVGRPERARPPGAERRGRARTRHGAAALSTSSRSGTATPASAAGRSGSTAARAR